MYNVNIQKGMTLLPTALEYVDPADSITISCRKSTSITYVALSSTITRGKGLGPVYININININSVFPQRTRPKSQLVCAVFDGL